MTPQLRQRRVLHSSNIFLLSFFASSQGRCIRHDRRPYQSISPALLGQPVSAEWLTLSPLMSQSSSSSLSAPVEISVAPLRRHVAVDRAAGFCQHPARQTGTRTALLSVAGFSPAPSPQPPPPISRDALWSPPQPTRPTTSQ